MWLILPHHGLCFDDWFYLQFSLIYLCFIVVLGCKEHEVGVEGLFV